MKKFKTKLIFLLTIIYLFKETNQRLKCNQKLLQTFKLSGLKYSVQDTMHICPSVGERCCTLMDELSILKLWNNFARPNIRLYHEQLFKSYSDILMMVEKIKKEFPIENIVVSYIKHKWVPYRKYYCQELAQEMDEESIMQTIVPGKGKLKKFDMKSEDKIFEMQENLLNKGGVLIYKGILCKLFQKFADLKFNKKKTEKRYQIQDIWKEEENIKDLDLVKTLLSDIDFEKLKNEFFKFQRKSRAKIEKTFYALVGNYTGKINKDDMIQMRGEFFDYYGKYLKKIMDFMKRYNKIKQPFKRYETISNMKIQLDQDTTECLNFLNKFMKKKFDSMEIMFETKLNKNLNRAKIQSGAKKILQAGPTGLAREKKKMLAEAIKDSGLFKKERDYDPSSDLLRKEPLTSFEKKNLEFKMNKNPGAFLPIFRERNLTSNGKEINHSPKRKLVWGKIVSFFTGKKKDPKKEARKKKLKEKIKKFKKLEKEFFEKIDRFTATKMEADFYKNIEIRIPGLTPEVLNFECKQKPRYMFKQIVVNNKSKMKFCYSSYHKLMELNLNAIKIKLEAVKISSMNILGLKRTVYCSVCDAYQQNSFDHKRDLIVYEEEFCRSMLKEHESYLIFQNVVMVELIDLVYQITKCLETTGNVYDFPFKSVIDEKKRRITFFNRCTKNMDRPDFMKFCYFVCSDFKLMGFSKMWDGDIEFLKQIMFEIYQFLIKNNIKDMPSIPYYEMSIKTEVQRDAPSKQPLPTLDPAEQILQEKLAKLLKEQNLIMSRDVETSGPLKEVESPLDRIDSLPIYMTPEYKLKCSQCELGKIGKKCRKQFCPPRDPCRQCDKLKLKGVAYSDCRIKNCATLKSLNEGFDRKPLNLKSKDVNERELKNKDKNNENNKKTDKKEMNVNSSNQERILSENKNKSNKKGSNNEESIVSVLNKDEIFFKKELTYTIENYRAFYTRNVRGMNLINMDAEVDFEQFDYRKLLELQYKRYQSEKLDRKLVTDVLLINKDYLHDFNEDILLHFQEIQQKKKVTKKKKTDKQIAKEKKIKFEAKIENNEVLNMISKRKNYDKTPAMPDYSYILNDVGENSNDSASKTLLGAFHLKTDNPDDPRDFDPFAP